MTTPTPSPSWHGADPNLPDFRDRLHERYHHLRDVAPVNLTPGGYWRLSRHADVETLLKRTKVGVRTTDGKLTSTDESKLPRLFMLEEDPPNHTRLRRLVARYFTPKAMRALHERVIAITNSLLDGMGSQEVDLISALALPLPVAVICEIMGVAAEDRHRFGEWSGDMTYLLMGDNASADQQRRANAGVMHMSGYIMRAIEQRRRSPSDDLISVLVGAERDGEQLSHAELLWQCLGLVLAGFETTTGLIGNGVRQLLLHREQVERLRADPSLIDTAVEECLRYDPPVVATGRVLHEPAEFGGYRLPTNSKVIALLAAANRDPAVFEDPDRFDIGRDPNPHLGFGGGPHLCLGAHLARLEARVAIASLFERRPNLVLRSERTSWTNSLFRIPSSLVVGT